MRFHFDRVLSVLLLFSLLLLVISIVIAIFKGEYHKEPVTSKPERVYDGCKYVLMGDNNTPNTWVHKGNCNNPAHQK